MTKDKSTNTVARRLTSSEQNEVASRNRQATKEQLERWTPFLKAQGITDPYKINWMCIYCDTHMKEEMVQIDKGIIPTIDPDGVLEKFEDAKYTEVKTEKKIGFWQRLINYIKSFFEKPKFDK